MVNIGDTFGKLTVLDNTKVKIKNSYYYKVQCSCGKEYLVQCMSLVHDKTTQCKSCAVLNKRTLINVGDSYNNWTVIESNIVINKQLRHRVRCSCGNERLITSSQLTSNNKYIQCKKCNDGKLLNGFRTGFLVKIQRNAILRNKEFSSDLTPEYLYNLLESQNFKCALSGEELLPLDGSLDHKQQDMNISLDRIDASKGYIIDNVQWVTKQINWAKNTLNNEDFVALCSKVVNYVNQQPSTPLKKCEGSETNS